MRILGIVKYNGYHYQGWQRQPNALSIQEEIEKVLSQFFNQPITIYGAGRTDAQVHALRQHFHFDVNKEEIDFSRALYSLNMMLPEDIELISLKEVDDNFHARYDAKEKRYSYTIYKSNKNVFSYQLVSLIPEKLDTDLMSEALTHFIGEHCFKNFTSKKEDKDNFIRIINKATLEENEESIVINFQGNGFMQYQIRFMVGMLIEIGKHKREIDEIDYLLDEKSERNISSYKAPASGLYLVDVIY